MEDKTKETDSSIIGIDKKDEIKVPNNEKETTDQKNESEKLVEITDEKEKLTFTQDKTSVTNNDKDNTTRKIEGKDTVTRTQEENIKMQKFLEACLLILEKKEIEKKPIDEILGHIACKLSKGRPLTVYPGNPIVSDAYLRFNLHKLKENFWNFKYICSIYNIKCDFDTKEVERDLDKVLSFEFF
jgi:hypothetical protein